MEALPSGFGSKEGKIVFGEAPRFFSDDRSDDILRQRSDFILQLRKFGTVCLRRKIAPRRKHLAELYEHRPDSPHARRRCAARARSPGSCLMNSSPTIPMP